MNKRDTFCGVTEMRKFIANAQLNRKVSPSAPPRFPSQKALRTSPNLGLRCHKDTTYGPSWVVSIVLCPNSLKKFLLVFHIGNDLPRKTWCGFGVGRSQLSNGHSASCGDLYHTGKFRLTECAFSGKFIISTFQ
jgi:hypothetical protein